eukprot:Hpha_TRINITY_DN10695_c1_g1::TRINITY_DN10695_c1_g1_i1::g.156929::m.156929
MEGAERYVVEVPPLPQWSGTYTKLDKMHRGRPVWGSGDRRLFHESGLWMMGSEEEMIDGICWVAGCDDSLGKPPHFTENWRYVPEADADCIDDPSISVREDTADQAPPDVGDPPEGESLPPGASETPPEGAPAPAEPPVEPQAPAPLDPQEVEGPAEGLPRMATEVALPESPKSQGATSPTSPAQLRTSPKSEPLVPVAGEHVTETQGEEGRRVDEEEAEPVVAAAEPAGPVPPCDEGKGAVDPLHQADTELVSAPEVRSQEDEPRLSEPPADPESPVVVDPASQRTAPQEAPSGVEIEEERSRAAPAPPPPPTPPPPPPPPGGVSVSHPPVQLRVTSPPSPTAPPPPAPPESVSVMEPTPDVVPEPAAVSARDPPAPLEPVRDIAEEKQAVARPPRLKSPRAKRRGNKHAQPTSLAPWEFKYVEICEGNGRTAIHERQAATRRQLRALHRATLDESAASAEAANRGQRRSAKRQPKAQGDLITKELRRLRRDAEYAVSSGSVIGIGAVASPPRWLSPQRPHHSVSPGVLSAPPAAPTNNFVAHPPIQSGYVPHPNKVCWGGADLWIARQEQFR